MSNELKPCPLCAAAVEITHAEGVGYEIFCHACDRVSVGFFFTESHARETWNTRPAEDALRAEVELLRVTNRQLKEQVAVMQRQVSQ